jgi:hypothetical protein
MIQCENMREPGGGVGRNVGCPAERGTIEMEAMPRSPSGLDIGGK